MIDADNYAWVKCSAHYGQITMSTERGIFVFREYDESGRLIKVTECAPLVRIAP